MINFLNEYTTQNFVKIRIKIIKFALKYCICNLFEIEENLPSQIVANLNRENVKYSLSFQERSRENNETEIVSRFDEV